MRIVAPDLNRLTVGNTWHVQSSCDLQAVRLPLQQREHVTDSTFAAFFAQGEITAGKM